MHDYYYVTDCVSAKGEDITAMLETAVEVTRATFCRHAKRLERCYVERACGYDLGPSRGGGLRMANDPHVAYFKGRYRGIPAYWFTWSAIEYVFTLEGMVE
jgi:hypothetical protein